MNYLLIMFLLLFFSAEADFNAGIKKDFISSSKVYPQRESKSFYNRFNLQRNTTYSNDPKKVSIAGCTLLHEYDIPTIASAALWAYILRDTSSVEMIIEKDKNGCLSIQENSPFTITQIVASSYLKARLNDAVHVIEKELGVRDFLSDKRILGAIYMFGQQFLKQYIIDSIVQKISI